MQHGRSPRKCRLSRTHIKSRRIIASVALLLSAIVPGAAIGSGTATAAGTDNATSPEDQIITAAAQNGGSGWELGAGVAVSEPGYVGVSNQVTPLPLVFYHNGRFFIAGVSVGYVPFNGRHYAFAILANPRINRLSASESPQLTGIQSRKWSIDGGARWSLFGRWGQLTSSLFTDLLHRNNGMEAELSYQYPIRGRGWSLAPGVGVTWDNAPLTAYYYGVSPAEAAPGRPAYEPGRATNPFVRLYSQVPVGKHWQFVGGLTYMHFARSIQNSPIVDRSDTLSVFLGLSYRFESKLH